MSHENSCNKRNMMRLIDNLQNENSFVRMDAAGELGDIGDVRAVDPLMKALKDENRFVRIKAAEALGNIGDARALNELIMILRDDDNYVRNKTEEAILKYGFSAIGPLAVYHEDVHSDLPKIAVDILNTLCPQITVITFGGIQIEEGNTVLNNPDVLKLKTPFINLSKIILYIDSYDFHQVERFITYAINYIGKDHLKNNVEVHIHGDPDKLHPNINNLFVKLCKTIVFHKSI